MLALKIPGKSLIVPPSLQVRRGIDIFFIMPQPQVTLVSMSNVAWIF
jgi:hypothetical protein